MKKHYNASSLDEVLSNSDIDTGSRSKLFVTDGNTGLIKRLLATIFGLGIIPLIFSSSKLMLIIVPFQLLKMKLFNTSLSQYMLRCLTCLSLACSKNYC